MAAAAILPELATQVIIPVAAAVGIAFAVLQWVLVSKVRLSPERRAEGGTGAGKSGGASDYLIEEEEGLNDHDVVVKCAEIQNAISEGECGGLSQIWGASLGSFRSARFVAVLAEKDAASARFWRG